MIHAICDARRLRLPDPPSPWYSSNNTRDLRCARSVIRAFHDGLAAPPLLDLRTMMHATCDARELRFTGSMVASFPPPNFRVMTHASCGSRELRFRVPPSAQIFEQRYARATMARSPRRPNLGAMVHASYDSRKMWYTRNTASSCPHPNVRAMIHVSYDAREL